MLTFKKVFIAGISLSLVVSAASITTTSYQTSMLSAPLQKEYFLFDDLIFTNKDDVLNYTLNKSQKTSYLTSTNKYVLDGKVFNNQTNLRTYIDNKFMISSLDTLIDPNNYLINSTDEIDSIVANEQNDKLVRVYEGDNNQAYFNKQDALETYQNYEQVYEVAGRDYSYNKTDALKVYQDVIAQELRNNPQTQTVYYNGPIQQTEGQIKQWLASKMKLGFTYNGKTYSDLNAGSFEEDILNGTNNDILNQHLTQIAYPDYSTYWLQDYQTNGGYYIGPKYIASTEKLDLNPKFHVIGEVDDYTDDIKKQKEIRENNAALELLNNVSEIAFEENIETKEFDWNVINGELTIQRFINFLYDNEFINRKLFDDVNDKIINKFIEKGYRNILSKSADDLSRIKDSSFGNVEKMFVMFNRILQDLQVIDTDRSGLDITMVNSIFKDVVLSVLATNNDVIMKELQEDVFSELIKDNPKESFSELIDFNNLFYLYMDPTKFYQGDLYGLIPLINQTINSQKIFDGIMGIVNDVAGIAKDAKSHYDKKHGNNSSTKHNLIIKPFKEEDSVDDFLAAAQSDLDYSYRVESVQFAGKKMIESRADDLLNAWGIVEKKNPDKVVEPQFFTGIMIFIGVISLFWTMAKLLSTTTWKIFEFDIDKSQKGYYVMPVYHKVFTKEEYGETEPRTELISLSKSLSDGLGKDEAGIKYQSIWKFEDHFYPNYETAVAALVKAIKKNPEKYLPVKRILVNIMENDMYYDISGIEDPNDNDPNLIKNAINNYSEQLFNLYYKNNNPQKLYLDGFGGAWQNVDEAILSLKKHIKSGNFNIKYEYANQQNQKQYFDSEQAVRNYITKNQNINSKLVWQSDLLKTLNYSYLKESFDVSRTVYKLDFYGIEKYFLSERGAIRYLNNHLTVTKVALPVTFDFYDYEGFHFDSTKDFKKWINNQITVLSESEAEQLNKAGVKYA